MDMALVGTYRIHIKPRSRYGFAELAVGESIVTQGVYRLIRVNADGFRIRWGMHFLVKDLGEGKVEIKRYK